MFLAAFAKPTYSGWQENIICGAIKRSGGLCKHKGNIRNSRCKRHCGDSTGPVNQTFGKDHHRYVHGLRTKEVIAMRKLFLEMTKSRIN